MEDKNNLFHRMLTETKIPNQQFCLFLFTVHSHRGYSKYDTVTEDRTQKEFEKKVENVFPPFDRWGRSLHMHENEHRNHLS
jgi:hypothetical protein